MPHQFPVDIFYFKIMIQIFVVVVVVVALILSHQCQLLWLIASVWLFCLLWRMRAPYFIMHVLFSEKIVICYLFPTDATFTVITIIIIVMIIIIITITMDIVVYMYINTIHVPPILLSKKLLRFYEVQSYSQYPTDMSNVLLKVND